MLKNIPQTTDLVPVLSTIKKMQMVETKIIIFFLAFTLGKNSSDNELIKMYPEEIATAFVPIPSNANLAFSTSEGVKIPKSESNETIPPIIVSP